FIVVFFFFFFFFQAEDGIRDLIVTGVQTCALPISYSFCNGEPFDIRESPSTVGALSERFRMLPEVRRTADPIFSTAVMGRVPPEWERPLFAVGDRDCFGEESVFAYLRRSSAKLAFFGVGFEFCTFVHHVEQLLGVPYRYMKDFSGTVV